MISMPEHSLPPVHPSQGAKANQAKSRRQRIAAPAEDRSENVHLWLEPGLVAEEGGPKVLPAAVLGHSGVLRF